MNLFWKTVDVSLVSMYAWIFRTSSFSFASPNMGFSKQAALVLPIYTWLFSKEAALVLPVQT
jgi:hypothetical protein